MKFLPVLLVLVLATTAAFAYDPSPLQDFCVGVNCTRDGVYVNGKFCKHPNLVTAEDFTCTRFRTRGNTSNRLRSKVTLAFVDEFLGLNTLGISIGRIDFARHGVNPPHTHPRASEILLVIKGTLYVGFVSSDQLGNRLFARILHPGDLFTVPMGLIHFQVNIGKSRALAFASFNSQNPGVITIAGSIFGSQPLIPVDVLTKSFRLDRRVVEYLQSQTWRDNATYA